MDNTEKLLKALTEAPGPSGYEQGIRSVVRQYLKDCGEVSYDKIGSIICHKVGTRTAPKVMIAAHMDEIGFMVKLITKDGFIHFTGLGGWPSQVLPAQLVEVHTNKGIVKGVIASKPPHLMTAEERKKLVEAKDLIIDIGATTDEEVKATGIRVGDPIVPVGSFNILNVKEKTYMAKAMDNRVGVGLAIATMQSIKGNPNSLYAAMTVQEEVGCRGAKTSVEMIQPDVAIVLDVDIAGDIPGIKPSESSLKMGGGPSIMAYDARTIPNTALRDLVIDTADELKIPVQLSAMEGGANDGSMIHLSRIGVPTIAIGVATRHIHSHNSIIRRTDFDNSLKLITAVIKKLNKKTVDSLTDFSK